jgi:hypothetical protein
MEQRNADDSRLAELGCLLARAYLRLAQKARNSAVFRSGEPQVCLDVSGPESPHVNERRPPWKAA